MAPLSNAAVSECKRLYSLIRYRGKISRSIKVHTGAVFDKQTSPYSETRREMQSLSRFLRIVYFSPHNTSVLLVVRQQLTGHCMLEGLPP